MSRHAALVTLTLLAFAVPAHCQPAGKEDKLKQAMKLVDGLKGKSPQQQSYLKLMSLRPLPKELAPVLSKFIATETGDGRAVAAAVLAEITPDDASLAKPLAEGLATKNTYVQIAAMKGFAQLGSLAKSALPEILGAMDSPNVQMRMVGVPVAASMGKAAIVPLEKIILQTVAARKKNDQAAAALGKIGPDALPTILKMFDMDDPAIDYHAAVALKSMDKKPIEALKPMLRMAQHKDANVRRLVFEYLVAVTPPTEEINAALWAGLDDSSGVIVSKCMAALRTRVTDKKKWGDALKARLERVQYHGSGLDLLSEYYALDRPAADAFMLPAIQRILNYQFTPKSRIAQLSTMEKEIIPHLPVVYKYLDGPSTGKISSKLNAIALLTFLPAEHTKPVAAKLQGDLKAQRWELKLIAAQALFRTNPSDKAAIAKAMADVLATPKLPYELRPDDVLRDLRAMGPDAKAAVPTLRIAQTTAKNDLKAKILLTMVHLDLEQKDFAVTNAQKMSLDAKDPYSGTAVLLELGAIKSDEGLKTIARGLEGARVNFQAIRAIDMLGPKAKALAPKLEALISDPKSGNAIGAIIALGKADGNRKLMLDRLVQIARDDPYQLGNIGLACANLGAEARPILPTLIEIQIESQRPSSGDFVESIARLDPTLLIRIRDDGAAKK